MVEAIILTVEMLGAIIGTVFGAGVTIIGLIALGAKLGSMYISEKRFDKYTEHVDSRFDAIEKKLTQLYEAVETIANHTGTRELPDDDER